MIKKSLKFLFTILVLSVVVSPVYAVTTLSESQEFSDVPVTNTYYVPISHLRSQGVVNGYEDGNFGVNDNLTRAQAAVMIVNAIGFEYSSREQIFTDVPTDFWANQHITQAYQMDMLNGYEDGNFGPDDYITRAQLSVIISKAFGLETLTNVPFIFRDIPESYWAYPFIRNLSSRLIVNGYIDGRFGPDDFVTRGQFSKFLSRAILAKLFE